MFNNKFLEIRKRLSFSNAKQIIKCFSEIANTAPLGDKVQFKFVYLGDKREVDIEAFEGQNILEVAHKYDVDLEGACDASLACSTCHVILEKDIYDVIPAAKEEEEDLLDLAYGLTETSRLGCQTIITKLFEGRKVFIPSATRNLYVDGKKPAKH